ncbi:MAG: ATP-binding protein [Moraxella sp.]|nr:ATP-binding protein [Moraxella sp.]
MSVLTRAIKELLFYRGLLFFACVGIVSVAFGLFWGACFGLFLLCCLVCYESVQLWRLLAWLDGTSSYPIFHERSVWALLAARILANDERYHKQKQQMTELVHRFDELLAVLPVGVLLVRSGGQVLWASELAKRHFKLSGKVSHNPLTFGNEKSGQPLAEVDKLWQSDELGVFLRQTPTSAVHKKILLEQGMEATWLSLSLVSFERDVNLLFSEDVSTKERLDAMRSDFVANASHELRTPLTVIQGFLETLQEYPDLEHAMRGQFVALMRDESEKMLTIINHLLALSRLENPEHSTFLPVDLSALCQKVAEDTEALALHAGQGHQVVATVCKDSWVMGDYDMLYAALSNLAFNAIWHTKAGTSVTLGLAKDGENIRFFVADNGEGIASHHLPRLTERFYRASQGRERPHKNHGTGLGLAIAKHALARHGGTLQVESTLGMGTRFWVILPLFAHKNER